MFKGLGSLASLMMNPQAMKEKVLEAGRKLREARCLGTGGGGLVVIEMDGLMDVTHCRIAPQLLDPAEKAALEGMVAQAIGEAVAKARALYAEEMKTVVGDVPGLDGSLKGLMG